MLENITGLRWDWPEFLSRGEKQSSSGNTVSTTNITRNWVVLVMDSFWKHALRNCMKQQPGGFSQYWQITLTEGSPVPLIPQTSCCIYCYVRKKALIKCHRSLKSAKMDLIFKVSYKVTFGV